MKNRNLISRKLENTQAKITIALNMVKTQQPISNYIVTLEELSNILKEIQDLIEMEPRSIGE
jgi:hypothetical protein